MQPTNPAATKEPTPADGVNCSTHTALTHNCASTQTQHRRWLQLLSHSCTDAASTLQLVNYAPVTLAAAAAVTRMHQHCKHASAAHTLPAIPAPSHPPEEHPWLIKELKGHQCVRVQLAGELCWKPELLQRLLCFQATPEAPVRPHAAAARLPGPAAASIGRTALLRR